MLEAQSLLWQYENGNRQIGNRQQVVEHSRGLFGRAVGYRERLTASMMRFSSCLALRSVLSFAISSSDLGCQRFFASAAAFCAARFCCIACAKPQSQTQRCHRTSTERAQREGIWWLRAHRQCRGRLPGHDPDPAAGILQQDDFAYSLEGQVERDGLVVPLLFRVQRSLLLDLLAAGLRGCHACHTRQVFSWSVVMAGRCERRRSGTVGGGGQSSRDRSRLRLLHANCRSAPDSGVYIRAKWPSTESSSM